MTFAHGITSPGEVWGSWSLDPLPIAGCLVAAGLYALGARRLSWKPRRRIVSFYLGLGVVAVAVLSPLDALASTLFSAHMVQHLLLLLVAPPLLVYSRPLLTSMVGLPRGPRALGRKLESTPVGRASSRASTSAVLVLSLNVIVLWAWHLPALYEAALSTEIVHAVEHLAFLSIALAFWNLVLGKEIGRSAALVFGNLLQSGALGAILVFATTVLYPIHAAGAARWGLTPLEDQQLAGAIMWIPAGIVYISTLAVLFLAWLREMDLNDTSPRAGMAEADG